MVLHTDHDLILHRQLGRLPHRGENGHAYRVGGRSSRPERHLLRNVGRRLHHDILQRLSTIEALKGRPKIVLIDACRNDALPWTGTLEGIADILRKQIERTVKVRYCIQMILNF